MSGPPGRQGAEVDARPEPLARLAGVAELLTSQGHHVDVATDGGRALEKLSASRYDVVLCDLRMPGMDGPTFFAEVQKRHPGQERRFVFLTGDSIGGHFAGFLEQAGVPSLSKPFRLEAIERIVAQMLSGGAARP